MVVFNLDDVEIFFPYDYIYPEQYAYMKYLKKTLDSEGHCVLEMPTGTGKTVAIFSLITSYQYHKKDEGKFIFCTRTVAEMEKSLIELKKVIQYRINVMKQRKVEKLKNEKDDVNDVIKNDDVNDVIKNDDVNDVINNDDEEGANNSLDGSKENVKEYNKHDDHINNLKEFGENSEILAIGISARRCMCINDKVLLKHEREKIDEECRKLTATFIREKKYINNKIDNEIYHPNVDKISDFILRNRHHLDIEDYFDIYNSRNSLEEYDNIGLCGYYENYKKEFLYDLIKPGVYTIEDLKVLCKNYKNKENVNVPICPYFCAKKIIEISKVIILNYQYVIDPKVSKALFSWKDMNKNVHLKNKNDIIVFDEAHNIDSVCLEALSVNIDRNILNKASMNITKLMKKIEQSKMLNEQKLKEECNKILEKIKLQKCNQSLNVTNNVINIDNMKCINHMDNINKTRSDGNVGSYLEKETNKHHNIEGKPGELFVTNEQEKKKRKVESSPVAYFDEDMNLMFSDFFLDESFGDNEKKKKNHDNNNDINNDDIKINDDIKNNDDINNDDRNNNDDINNNNNDRNNNNGRNNNNDRNNNNEDEDHLNDLCYSPLLMEDIIKNVVIPGNIRKSEHFLNLMRIVVVYLKKYINIYDITSEGPLSFLYKFEKDTKLDTSFFKYCFDRLKSLLNNLQIVNIEDYSSLNIVCNFCTLLGNYFKGFIIICEPYPEATGIYDPLIQFACLDSSIAMKTVINKYKSIILTSGTITPLELYPKLLNFKTVLTASFPMSFDRNCVCPLIVTKGSDLIPLSSQFSLRNDLSVIKNYGILLVDMCKCIPDGIVAYFPSYIYMEQVISSWYELGVIANILEYKLIFIETKDIVSTTIALHNFKKACDLGKGAVFLSICRGKIAEGIDFDKHYGKCVILFGIPYQYTLSKILKSRLDFLKETYNIQENEFLTFDAMRQASQCVGRIIRNKKDYGIMIFSDIRYAKHDKKNKLPPWIIKCMDISNINLTVTTAVDISKQFLLNMSQEYRETGQTKISPLMLKNQVKCWTMVKSILNMDDFI
ncbi:TFIIH basal transcription factor complex helicase XPD subunit [Plasmodium falciparum NF54]|uniref:DNA 5'-3' helicase n=2 Tax=Plasmodium falciparum TaxID=5833 RepID=Q8I2H7_PLAF7|nr:TFIIH basal transcription factor complex helicase XPD subunit [Plasmodium falciparum 3D7]KAF4330462.1 TFIIH basal transcription factor complex helicase XPD subunit [Plasmodium falciparum NF54]PKC45259.1 TFIIH basal transcription factor complex helicase XPD subunit [Plasmodium falciparum NF54]CAD52016.1 TFIIH basal transcription factor complex helicase XPD subunit [Plasmodium falciparum 3D7]|eukprot:XP_001352206.1 TFIIH basal transcription factor complex helicase XPD subunit [Plasmodium falciparum 3D7]